MTDNETIMALKYCIEGGLCALCPLMSETFCMGLLHRSVFELINRQKVESERYLHSIKLLEKDVQTANAEIERLQVELEFKCDNCENIRLSREEYRKAILQAKSEAIKDFAERLKKVISISDTQKPYFDNLIKELVGDGSVEK